MRIILGLLCLCFLIFFHELGHFLAAKLFHVKVESFSIGFGPVLLHKTVRGTDYRISLVPLGGYCGMKGEQDFLRALENQSAFIDAEPDSLYGIHPLKRILIALAGPFHNLFFAFLGSTIIALIGYSYYSYSNQVNLATDTYPELHSAAADAGIRSGDRILRINNAKITNFNDLLTEVASRPDEDIDVTVERDGEQLVFSVHTDLDKESGAGKIGLAAIPDSAQKYAEPRRSFFPALLKGATECAKMTALTVKGIFTLFKGVDLTKTVSGPARIADMMGTVVKESFSESLRTGIVNLLSFTGIISISLFIMNLLPVPVLDGGLILFALIELVFRRKMNPKILYYIQFVGIAFIALLFVIGLRGDIAYFVQAFKGSR